MANNTLSDLVKLLSNNIIIKRNKKTDKIKVLDFDNLQQSKDIHRYDRIYRNTIDIATQTRLKTWGFQNIKFQLFRDYQEMDKDPIVSSILNLYSQEVVAKNEYGDVLIIKSQNQQIADLLDNLFYNILNIQFTLPSWVRSVCKYGDMYLYLNILPDIGITNVVPLSVYQMERLQGQDKQNLGRVQFSFMGSKNYLQAFEIAHFRLLSDSNFLPYGKSMLQGARKTWKQLCLHQDTNIWTPCGYKKIKDINCGDTVYSYDYTNNLYIPTKVKNCIKTGNKPIVQVKTSHYTIKGTQEHPLMTHDGSYVQIKDLNLNSNLIVADIQNKQKNTYQLNIHSKFVQKIKSITYTNQMCDVYDIQVDSQLHNFVADGIIAHNCLLEDAMLVHKIMRAPQKRIYNIDVGGMPPNKIQPYVRQYINKTKKIPYVNPQTGQYNMRFNLMNMTQDFYIPRRGGSDGNSIQTLGGFQLDFTNQLNYLRQKMMSSFRVPLAYVGYEQNINAKATLASQDLRFAKTIQRIQRFIVSQLQKIATIHLYCNGYRGWDLLDFQLTLNNPSVIYEQQKIALWNQKFNLLNTIKSTQTVSSDWCFKNVLNMTPQQIAQERKQLQKDKLRAFRLNKLQQQGTVQEQEENWDNGDDMPFGGDDSFGGGNRTIGANFDRFGSDDDMDDDMDSRETEMPSPQPKQERPQPQTPKQTTPTPQPKPQPKPQKPAPQPKQENKIHKSPSYYQAYSTHKSNKAPRPYGGRTSLRDVFSIGQSVQMMDKTPVRRNRTFISLDQQQMYQLDLFLSNNSKKTIIK